MLFDNLLVDDLKLDRTCQACLLIEKLGQLWFFGVLCSSTIVSSGGGQLWFFGALCSSTTLRGAGGHE